MLWQDLKNNPEHGSTLSLLARALRAQDKGDEAAAVEARFRKAWKDADVTPTTSAPDR